MASQKRKVLVLGSPLDYVDNDYLDEFRGDYDLDVRLQFVDMSKHTKTK